MAAGTAHAQFLDQSRKTDFLLTGTSQILKDATMYRPVYDTFELDFSQTLGQAPIKVDSAVVAVIKLRKGQTIKVTGSNAYSKTDTPVSVIPAKPGIEIHPCGTLIVMGEGEVIAYGGRAGDGTMGEMGGCGSAQNGHATPGFGGAGGFGGGGSAPGIGGIGGLGGVGGKRVETSDHKVDFHKDMELYSQDGNKGGPAGNGGNMGKLIVLGGIKVTAVAGAQGVTPSGYAPRGSVDIYRNRGGFMRLELSNLCKVGYGGSGGNGAAGEAANYGIGGGGAGGAGAGSGGAGGIHSRSTSDHIKFYTGQGGRGGDSNVEKLAGRHGGGLPLDGHGYGGKSGATAVHGQPGSILYTATTDLSGSTYKSESAYLINIIDSIPQSVRQFIVHSMKCDVWEDKQPYSYYYGQEIKPEKVQRQESKEKTFLGYYDEHGHRIYDADGNPNFAACNEFFTHDTKNDKWYWSAFKDVELTPRYGGSTRIIAIHHVADPNFNGRQSDESRFDNPDYIFTEQIDVPEEDIETVHTYDAYMSLADGSKMIINKELYKAQSEHVDVNVYPHMDVAYVDFFYDGNAHTLKWDGISDRFFSFACLNESTYTKDGSYAYGKTIVPPAFKTFEGNIVTGWVAKDGNGNTIQFDGTLPNCDITLSPIFSKQTYNAMATECENGTVSLSATKDINFGDKVTIDAVANKHYILESVKAINTLTGSELQIAQDNTFVMPDADVKIIATFKYHPHATLDIYKAAEGGDAFVENVKCFITIDGDESKMIYTNDNDYFKFDEGKYKPVESLEFTTKNILNIFPEYVGDKGAREPHLYVYDKNDGDDVVDEIQLGGNTFNGTQRHCFRLIINNDDNIISYPLELYYSASRPKYVIKEEMPEGTSILHIEAIGRDITDEKKAYGDEVIAFTLSSNIKQYQYGSVTVEYDYGFDKKYQNISPSSEETEKDEDEKSLSDMTFSFVMPDADVVIHVDDGEFQDIETQEFSFGSIHAPACAVPGSFVPCTILLNNINDIETDYLPNIDENFDVWVNGAPAQKDDDSYVYDSSRRKVSEWMSPNYLNPDLDDDFRIIHTYFQMPESSAYVHLPGYSPDGIKEIENDFSKKGNSGIYSLSGLQLSKPQRGINIIDGKKINVR